MIKVGFRPTGLVLGVGKRAAAVGCDFPLCEKALEFPVNLQATDTQCINDTIRYMKRAKPHGWFTNGRQFFCPNHIPASEKNK